MPSSREEKNVGRGCPGKRGEENPKKCSGGVYAENAQRRKPGRGRDDCMQNLHTIGRGSPEKQKRDRPEKRTGDCPANYGGVNLENLFQEGMQKNAHNREDHNKSLPGLPMQTGSGGQDDAVPGSMQKMHRNKNRRTPTSYEIENPKRPRIGKSRESPAGESRPQSFRRSGEKALKECMQKMHRDFRDSLKGRTGKFLSGKRRVFTIGKQGDKKGQGRIVSKTERQKERGQRFIWMTSTAMPPADRKGPKGRG